MEKRLKKDLTYIYNYYKYRATIKEICTYGDVSWIYFIDCKSGHVLFMQQDLLFNFNFNFTIDFNKIYEAPIFYEIT